MRRWSFLFLVVLLLFSSCTTISLESRPYWIDSTPEIPGLEVFVAKGEGSTETDAKTNAISAALSQMGEAIGYDLETMYFRELFSTQEILDLGARIADEYKWEIDGNWTYYIAVTADEEIFAAARTPESIEYRKNLDSITSLLDGSLEAYKENRDIEGVEKLLEALVLSLEGNISSEVLDPDLILEKALTYLGQIQIESAKKGRNDDEDSFVFRVVRKKGLMYPVVEEATVECSYWALTVEGEIKQFSHPAKTDSKGRFSFNRTNPYILRTGELKLSVRIDEDLMARLSRVAPSYMVEKIEEAVEKGSMVYSYSYAPLQDLESIAFAFAEYGYDGTLLKEEGHLASTLQRIFSIEGMDNVNLFFADGEDENENLESLLSLYDSFSQIYIIRMGVVGRNRIDDTIYSRAEGKIIRVDTATGEKTYTENFHYTGSGLSSQEADSMALSVLSSVISAYLLGEF